MSRLYIAGCEDIIAEAITVENLPRVLQWSLKPHGSTWVHRQAIHFLREEFVQIAHHPVLFELSREYLIEAISSDFLQVGISYRFLHFINFNLWHVSVTLLGQLHLSEKRIGFIAMLDCVRRSVQSPYHKL